MRRNRNGRPSLIGTAARTAVIAGTATAVVGAVGGSKQSAAQPMPAAQPQAAPAAPAAVGLSDDKFVQLQRLAELQNTGVLTEQEFADLKAKILAS